MKRILSIILVFCSVLLLLPYNAFGSGHEEHDKQMEYVVFGDEDYSKNHPGKIADIVTSLHYATYFCIDQYNYNKQAASDDQKLAFLKDRNVSGLPKNVVDYINYNAFGEKHRLYTHRGWSYSYSSTELQKSHWETRKEILIATVKKEFDPGLANNVLSFFGNDGAQSVTENFDSKCKRFAELLYYIHLVGDHIYDHEELEKSGLKEDQPYSVKDLIIYLGGTRDDATIIHDLKVCLNSLFSDQKDVNSLIKELDRIEKEIDTVRYVEGKVGGLNTVGRYMKYSSYAQDVLEALHEYVPDLLRNEAFFARVFYG